MVRVHSTRAQRLIIMILTHKKGTLEWENGNVFTLTINGCTETIYVENIIEHRTTLFDSLRWNTAVQINALTYHFSLFHVPNIIILPEHILMLDTGSYDTQAHYYTYIIYPRGVLTNK